MDPILAAWLLWGAVSLLGLIITLLLLYMVIRLGVKHALQSHTHWVDEGKF